MQLTDKNQSLRPTTSETDDERATFEDLPDEVRLLIFRNTTSTQQFFSLTHLNKRNYDLAHNKYLSAHEETLKKEAEEALSSKIKQQFDQCYEALKLTHNPKEATIPCEAWDPIHDDTISRERNIALTLFAPLLFT